MGSTMKIGDLQRLPDDGNRYELADGVPEATPVPLGIHGRATSRLRFLLGAHCPDSFEVLGPVGINLAPDLHRIPDLTVIRAEWFEPGYQTRPPVLVVEVASRSTKKRDKTKKLLEYEAFGVESYWIVESDQPTLTAYELHAGSYKEVGRAVGSEAFHVTKPFPVTIVPALLVVPGTAWKAGLG
jgi:Uma2 family endonuclease